MPAFSSVFLRTSKLRGNKFAYLMVTVMFFCLFYLLRLGFSPHFPKWNVYTFCRSRCCNVEFIFSPIKRNILSFVTVNLDLNWQCRNGCLCFAFSFQSGLSPGRAQRVFMQQWPCECFVSLQLQGGYAVAMSGALQWDAENKPGKCDPCIVTL